MNYIPLRVKTNYSLLTSLNTIESLAKRAKELNINKIALAGGVSANSYIRSEFLKLKDKGYDIYYPEPILCTDNAAMIASAVYYTYMTGNTSDLSLNAVPNLGIN